MHRAVGNRRYEAIALSDLGAIDFEEGRLADAELAYRHAISILADVGDRRNCALFTACAAAVAAATDDLELAQARFAAAAGVLTKVGDPLYLGAAAVHRGHLELALARRAADPVVAEEHRARARALIAYAEQRTTEGAPSLAELSDDVRFALRALTRALDSHARGVDGLLVGPDAAWFELNRRERITLANRVNMRRLLAALVSMRMRSPAEPIALDALYDVGWPGMKALGRAGANRVHVALAALRKLGLAEILLRRGQGYLLDPAVPVTLAPLAGTDEPSAGPPRSACPPDDLRRGLSGAQPPPQTP